MTTSQLGDLLVERGLITREQLDQALDVQEQMRPRPRLGALLMARKAVTEDQLLHVLADIARVPCWNPALDPPNPAAAELIPSVLAQTCRVIPLCSENGSLKCAAAGPLTPEERAKLEFLAGRPLQIVMGRESDISQQLQALYGVSVERMIAGLEGGVVSTADDQEIYLHDLREMAEEPTLINLVNAIISNAIEEQASDIHIEPFESEIRVKYRIDGLLHETPPPPKNLQFAIISRVKIMAGMDIAERFVPQDGQIRVNLLGERVDIRVSTVPTVFGEAVVLRLLKKDESLLNLAQLGMHSDLHGRFNSLLERPYGIILVCGPTGSGKTTTLYSALIQIQRPEKKIITIEDPVEYNIMGMNQIPVRPKRGLDFASGLRSILRQDPDIIMVGEIRDQETANIAIRAALTGHLVFSTLHTNDAPGAITRLIDMGVEPYLVASSIIGVLAQRLVRRLCRECRRAVLPDPMLTAEFECGTLPERIWEAVGCAACHGRGYRGRVGIFELLMMREDLHNLILHTGNGGEIRRAARREMVPMRMDGWDKILRGETSVAEVLQATHFEGGE